MDNAWIDDFDDDDAEPLACCLGSLPVDFAHHGGPVDDAGMLAAPMVSHADPEGDTVPGGRRDVVDAHVHLFPPRLFRAIWQWFDTWGWPIRYRLSSEDVLAHLLSRGVSHVVGLTYAHKPGIARDLNAYMAALMANEPRLTALGTVFPGEENARTVVEDAFRLGLKGVKLHCHVQCIAPDDARLDEVYGTAMDAGLPVVIHAGREPKSPGYRCDPHALCAATRVENVLRRFPSLTLVVPHFGADEIPAYRSLVENHENLWLDTTMMLADFFPVEIPHAFLASRPERLLYGSDFPNLPFAWDRELKRLLAIHLDENAMRLITSENARHVFQISSPVSSDVPFDDDQMSPNADVTSS